MNELFNKLLDDTFFDLYSHFKNKRQFYNDLGVELLTLAIFLKDHLTTDEPFPPTKDFINTVKKNIDYELHFENLENPENITKEKILKTISDTMVALENIPVVEVTIEDLGANLPIPITRKKNADIALLPLLAQQCFHYATFCSGLTVFYLSTTLIYRDGFAKELTGQLSSPDKNDIFEYWVRDLFAGLKESDVYTQAAFKIIGYWTRYIEELREHRKKAQTTNKKRTKKSSDNKQRIRKILNEMKNESKEIKKPYTVAGWVEKRWEKKWPGGLWSENAPPGQKFIVGVIKEWMNEQ